MIHASEWKYLNHALERHFEFSDFISAVAFVNNIAHIAEQMGHHPDIRIHEYRNVTLTLTTHRENGVTERDFQLAVRINAFVDMAEEK